jgi:acyl-CoA synthetase (AMP-forming)/AMP-acid ligase II
MLLARRIAFAPALARPALRTAHRLARPLSTIAAEHIFRSEYAPVEPPKSGLFHWLREAGAWHEVADKVALRCAMNGYAPITYGELDGRIIAASHQLRVLGFEQGDVLNIHLPNCQQFVVAFLATAALGGTVTTSNPMYTAAELATQHADSSTKFVLSSRALESVVSDAVAQSGVGSASVHWIEDGSCFANAQPVPGLTPPPLARPIDVAEDMVTLPYSSGHRRRGSNHHPSVGCGSVVPRTVAKRQ